MSRLGELAKAAEDATDAYVEAVDAASVAEAEYLRGYHSAFAETDPSWPNTRREAEAALRSFEQKVALKQAEHAVERAKAVMRTRIAILSAAQTQFKAVERQAG